MLKQKHRKGIGQSCVWLSCALGPLTALSQPRSVLQHTAAPPLALRSGSAAWLWAGLRPAVLTSHGSARPPPPPGVHVPQVRVRLHRRGDRGFQVRAVLRGDGELLWQKGAALSRHQRLPLLPHSASQPPHSWDPFLPAPCPHPPMLRSGPFPPRSLCPSHPSCPPPPSLPRCFGDPPPTVRSPAVSWTAVAWRTALRRSLQRCVVPRGALGWQGGAERCQRRCMTRRVPLSRSSGTTWTTPCSFPTSDPS